MSEITVSFATAMDGSSILVPRGTERIAIMGCNPGKAGPPWLVFLKGHDEAFSVAPDAPPSALRALPSGNYRGVFKDAAHKRIGKSFPFALQHLGGEPGAEKTSEASALGGRLEQMLDRLEAQNESLFEVVKTLVQVNTKLAEGAMQSQQQIIKVMPEAITASARMVDASHGGTFVETASALQKVSTILPSGDNNLETVLNSPVVIGAAAAFQKYMAKAAENGAEAMAGHAASKGESMAERAARLSAAADDRVARANARS